MTKLKAPFFSLQSQGTIAQTITTRRTTQTDIALAIPTHPDPNTLPQFYHRVHFTDAYAWYQSLTQAQKDQFRDQKYPPHLTAQQKAIRYYLTTIPDLLLWLRLDEPSGQHCLDSSPHHFNGVYTGTTVQTGKIHLARKFDGIDDQITIAHQTGFNIQSQDFTLCFWAMAENWAGYAFKWLDLTQPYWGHVIIQAPGLVARLYIYNPPLHTYNIPIPLTWLDGKWHHYAYVADRDALFSFYIDATLIGTANISNSQGSLANTGPFLSSWAGSRIDQPLDDLRLYLRALSQDHIRAIYTRQLWPPPS